MAAITYWLWLSGLNGLRPKAFERLLSHFGDPESIYFANSGEYDLLEGFQLNSWEKSQLREKSLDRAEGILETCERENISIITMSDGAYPQRLRNIYDPPAVLYVRGRLPWMDEECAIAIAGTRKATPYGIKMGRRMGYELTKGGALVVSGLAAGVDTAGAEGALRAGGRCVGVLGTAIDEVYPRFNARLFDDVAVVGAVVSEYPPGTPFNKAHFPQRNRILSGLSAGVVIIEAPERSGALITASRAADQGRDVFVVPGNADAENCRGSNMLIKDGAAAVTAGWDVLSEYTGRFPRKIRRLSRAEAAIPQEEEPAPTPEKPETLEKPEKPETTKKEPGRGFFKLRLPGKRIKKQPPGPEALKKALEDLSETQLKIVAAMTEPSMYIDDIAAKCGLPVKDVVPEMTMLQISGTVLQEPGKRFTLNITAGE